MIDAMLGDGITRQELNLIFVIDNSGSMAGEKLGAVNNAVRDILNDMPAIQEDTADAEIKISALKFSDSAQWVYSKPKSIDEFKWNDISVGGGTNLSEAYDKLCEWLTKKSNGGQMPDFGGVAPIIILMTDGMPTSYDWERHLAVLKKKGWFKVALKYALAIGIESREAMEVLQSFTENNETVLRVYTAEALRSVIRVIAVTASKVKSSSSSVSSFNGSDMDNNALAQQQINQQIKDEIPDCDGEW